MKIDIPDDLAHEAFTLLAAPADHRSLSPWLRSLVRHAIVAEKSRRGLIVAEAGRPVTITDRLREVGKDHAMETER